MPFSRSPAEGKAITTQLCVILDDHSRLITHAAYYLTGDTVTFLHSLKEAVLRRGLPHKLYTDQGKPFVSHHTRIVCANLGIRLLHAKPYHAWSKGKVERLIRTIQDDFEATARVRGCRFHRGGLVYQCAMPCGKFERPSAGMASISCDASEFRLLGCVGQGFPDFGYGDGFLFEVSFVAGFEELFKVGAE